MTVDIDDVKTALHTILAGMLPAGMLPEITSAITAQLTANNAIPNCYKGYRVNKQLGRYYSLMDGFTTIYIGKEWSADKADRAIEIRNRQVNVKIWQPVDKGLCAQCHKDNR